MKKRWIDPLFKPSEKSSRELNMFCSLKRFSPKYKDQAELAPSVTLNPKHSTSVFGKTCSPSFFDTLAANRLSYFFVSALCTVGLVIFVFCAQAKYSNNSEMTALDLFNYDLTNLDPIDKKTFIASFSDSTKRNTMNQIQYVTELIKNSTRSNVEAKRLAFTIVAESLRSGYDPLFVAAVIKSESTFKTHAVSYTGATGLMQIMPDTGRYVSKLKNVQWKGVGKLRDPEYNIKLGIAYLKHLEIAFRGNKELMLIAYNWGPANVNGALNSSKRFPYSTVRYARTILSNHGRWSADFSRSMAKFQYMNKELLS